jgi:superfamily II RNA helicase
VPPAIDQARAATLGDRLAAAAAAAGSATPGSDAALEVMLAWAGDQGLQLYPHQEQAMLEIAGGQHVILATPTGSGKSMVATAACLVALASGRRAVYTAPIKALVAERYVALARELGRDRVGMTTGDVSVRPDAPVLCCTAEILAQMCLRSGRQTPADVVVMDEFHYYGDPDRGMAWQVPLLVLNDARFVLMSATLGDVRHFEQALQQRTGAGVATIRSVERPVPLEYVYSESPLHEAIGKLLDRDRAPIYLVSFTQRQAAEEAQNLTSINLCSKQEKAAIAAALAHVRFDSPYGADLKKFLRHGVGVHHAGLLPKYRLLVEQLAQRGLLKVISGTDTLGVGINVPIRTVLLTSLNKYDGRQVAMLKVRDFQQIAGRAGRKGFDDRGTVVCQAPEHVIENLRLEAKAAGDPKKSKKFVRKKPPEKGYVHWDESTFRRLVDGTPEPLQSTFAVDHGVVLAMLDREVAHGRRDGGYRRLVRLIRDSDERPFDQRQHLRHAARLFRALEAAHVVERVRVPWSRGPAVRVATDLQRDFSLHHTLSLFLLDVLAALDPGSNDYPLDVLSAVEAILESPAVLLQAQVAAAKTELVAQLKAEGVEYEQRMAALEEVDHPKPLAELLYARFDGFRRIHPWVREDNVRPKAIARDMVERFASFSEYVNLYGLRRSEGVLLRYLAQAYRALLREVPEALRTAGSDDVLGFLRATLERVDASLLREWERLLGEAADDNLDEGEEAAVARERPLTADPAAFRARVRAELHRLLRAFALGDLEEAAASLRHRSERVGSVGAGDGLVAAADGMVEEAEASELAATLGAAREQFIVEHGGPPRFDLAARRPDRVRLQPITAAGGEPAMGSLCWRVSLDLLGPEDPDDEPGPWAVHATIDLTEDPSGAGPLLTLDRVGP